MFLFTDSTYLGYCIFIVADEKFMDVFVRVFTKSHVPGPHFGKSWCRLEKLSCNSEPNFMLFALNTPDCFYLTRYDFINYNNSSQKSELFFWRESA